MVITQAARKTSPREECKASPNDIEPNSGVSIGMDFDGSPKKKKQRIVRDKMSAFNLMEGKK